MLIISAKKKRNIGLSQISLTGSISSIKKNSLVQFESSLERDYIYLLENDTEVQNYYEQPFILTYYMDNKKSHYIPDFYVEYWDKQKYLIEIKYESELSENKAINSAKFNSAEEFCHKNGIIFQILTEKEIRTPKLENAKFLIGYRHPKFGYNDTDTNILIHLLLEYKKLTVNQLLDFSSKNMQERAINLYLIWHLVSTNIICYDKENKLTMNSVIWLL